MRRYRVRYDVTVMYYVYLFRLYTVCKVIPNVLLCVKLNMWFNLMLGTVMRKRFSSMKMSDFSYKFYRAPRGFIIDTKHSKIKSQMNPLNTFWATLF